jgi:hypothetical protein
MRHAPRMLSAMPAVLALGLLAAPASALPGLPGGTAAPSQAAGAAGTSARSGGTAQRPVLSLLSVPRTATAGAPPRVGLRFDEAGVGTVHVQVAVTDPATHRVVLNADLGWVRTARTTYVRWRAGASLSPGSYVLSVSAHDHHGGELLRLAHSSGRVALTVTAPPLAPPAPAPVPVPPVTPVVEAGVPTPAQSAAAGAVFPVSGAHNFGGPENRFGAPRGTHIHQGQDVLTTEGTPVVAPLAGTITWTSYQEGGAGYYAVEHTTVGLDLMFAHCQAASLAVSAEQPVTAGQLLCRAGQTGDATTPHLHFEMWVGGWQAATGHPIDPLPYLEAWEQAALASR